MCSRGVLILGFAIVTMVVACSSPKKLGEIRNGGTAVSLSLPSDEEIAEENEEEIAAVAVDTSRNGEPIIMNAIRDDETGEMVATDVIVASTVTARFRHVAERFGKILLEFDITVPEGMVDSKWQLRFYPTMVMMEDTTCLDPLFITGKKYRDAQIRGYQRYEAFLRSIVTDTLDFVQMKQLEVFLERNFPETFAMKNDTTVISEPDAVSLFGVTQRSALEHYTRHYLVSRNEKRKNNRDRMFRKYVKDPIETDGIRLDTVMTGDNGEFIFRYRQQVTSRPGLKKIVVSLRGEVYDFGRCIGVMPLPEDLVFYVSSLSSLADDTRRFKLRILERSVHDHTLALIDFSQGKAEVDTTLGDNASELRRILRCINDLSERSEFVPDSIVITASCSPEGSYSSNALLAEKRSKALTSYLDELQDDGTWKMVSRSIPENWTLLDVLVANDSTLSRRSREDMLEIIRSRSDRDAAERKLSRFSEYLHLRQHIYPRLRTVSLEFYLHRQGMVKDTIHTTELDTAYMRGVEALRELDYKTACEILRPYRDYNAAVALVASAYNWSALEILDGLNQNLPKVLYLKTIVYSRLDKKQEALDCYRRAVDLDPSMAYRANLDPEVAELVRKYDTTLYH